MARVEIRLTDLGINGKIKRLGPLKNLGETVKDEIKAGAKTLVIVGDDSTLGEVINLVAGKNVTLGIIPFGKNNQIANTLGIKDPETACEVLAARRIEKIDLGKINGGFFLHYAKILSNKVNLTCDGHYQINPSLADNDVFVYNLKYADPKAKSDPQDGILEAVVVPKSRLFSKHKDNEAQGQSIFPVKKVEISNGKTFSILTDGQNVIEGPVTVEVAPQKLKVVVGKERLF